MTTRMTRAAAAAAAAQTEFDAATNMALPSSPATTGLDTLHAESPKSTKRITSGSKSIALQIAEDANAGIESSPRPGSPAACAVLKPATKAKQLLNNERLGMRSSSNKENMKPLESPTRVAQEAPNVIATGRIGDVSGVAPATQTTEPESEGIAGDVPVAEMETLTIADVAPVITTTQDESIASPSKAVSGASKASKRVSVAPSSRPPMAPARQTTATKRTSTAAVKTAADRRASTAQGVRTAADRRTTAVPDRRTSTVIPHSKPRPMSMSFPTPPPPAKSDKVPTRPTFALPGEAVAARLKAAKEARAAASAPPAETEKRPAFKARPAPKMTPDAAKVRTTAASRARESLMFPDRRASLAVSSPKRPASSAAGPTGRQSMVSSSMSAGRPSMAQTGRQSMVSSSMSAGRPSLAPKSGSGTGKGKEVFGRAAASREAAIKAQKDKEDAARRARAEAAERGRQASKEWAEKHKLKMLKAKTAGQGVVAAK